MRHYVAGCSVQFGQREVGVEVRLMWGFIPTIHLIWELHDV